MENEEKKREKQKEFANVAVTGANAEIVQRYGAAVKEHLVSYSGTDNEAGKELKKSLKSIADSKVNPNDSARNLKRNRAGHAEFGELQLALGEADGMAARLQAQPPAALSCQCVDRVLQPCRLQPLFRLQTDLPFRTPWSLNPAQNLASKLLLLHTLTWQY